MEIKMNKRNISFLCVLMIACLLFTACPRRPKIVRTVNCVIVNNRPVCTVTVTIQFRGQPSEIDGQIFTNASGVFDLANEWQLDSAASSYATVKITKDNQQVTQSNFATHLTTVNNNSSVVNPVDKDTTPNLYVFQNPNDANDFVNQSSIGAEDVDVEVTYLIPIVPVDCGMPSEKQVNHIRYTESSGVTYLDSFILDYSVPASASATTRCEQATVTIGD
jgi:hypothetical protein